MNLGARTAMWSGGAKMPYSERLKYIQSTRSPEAKANDSDCPAYQWVDLEIPDTKVYGFDITFSRVYFWRWASWQIALGSLADNFNIFTYTSGSSLVYDYSIKLGFALRIKGGYYTLAGNLTYDDIFLTRSPRPPRTKEIRIIYSAIEGTARLFIDEVLKNEVSVPRESTVGTSGMNIYLGSSYYQNGYSNRPEYNAYGEVKLFDKNMIPLLSAIPVLDNKGVACMYDEISKKCLYDANGQEPFKAIRF